MSQIANNEYQNYSYEITITNTNSDTNTNTNNPFNLDEEDNDDNISRPFKCNFQDCNKDYSNKSRLEIHLRTHVNKRLNI
jgi:uncharacterized Zn-finger protein